MNRLNIELSTIQEKPSRTLSHIDLEKVAVTLKMNIPDDWYDISNEKLKNSSINASCSALTKSLLENFWEYEWQVWRFKNVEPSQVTLSNYQ
jgi:hypothetical protein